MARVGVVCIGEALVDFLPDRAGLPVRDVDSWTPHLGGAPANVAVGVARLGGRAALVAVTGGDEFGAFLVERLRREGVDARFVRRAPGRRTGLGFVSLTRAGERSFVFYRHETAETLLDEDDVARARPLLRGARVVHVGTSLLRAPRARRAVLGAVRAQASAGKIVSLDPNLRLHLWERPERLAALLRTLVPLCSIVKLSEEEIPFVTGTHDVEVALRRLERAGVALAVVTLGARGAVLRSRGRTSAVTAPRVRVVDTTGAGDGFSSGLAFCLASACGTRAELDELPHEAARRFVRFGCVLGARVVRRLGAVAGLPKASEVRAALERALSPS